MPPLDQLIPGVIGLSLTSGAGLYFSRLWWLARASRSWPTASGTLTSSQVVYGRKQKGGRTAWLRVTYAFHVDGTEFKGNRRYFGDFIDANEGVAKREAGRYPNGASVQVRYRPGDPATCTIETKTDWLVAGAALLGCGLALVILRALIFGE